MSSETINRRYIPDNGRPLDKTGVDNYVNIHNMDYTLFLVVLILTVIGIVMVFSSSYTTSAASPGLNNDPLFFVKRNAGVAVGGLAIMCMLTFIGYIHIRRATPLFYITTLGLLVIVMVFGITTRGATRWIPLPIPGVNQFQPSELAKPALILMLAYLFNKNPDRLKYWPGLIFCLAVVGIMAGMALYGSMSAAIILVIIGFSMIFIASRHIMRFIFLGVAGSGVIVSYLIYLAYFSTGSDVWRGVRFAAWRDPSSVSADARRQIVQSLGTVASGGFFGLGIGQSRQKFFLPEQYNDFIFAIICEELGLIGAGFVMLFFGILIWRGIRIALRAPDTFSSMAAAGIVISIASQVLINIAVVTNTIPVTGVTLPFISYGGTSLLISMAMMGILLNISRYSKSYAPDLTDSENAAEGAKQYYEPTPPERRNSRPPRNSGSNRGSRR